MIRVSIIGATGYTGRELFRYLLNHPDVKITHCTSESNPGRAIASVHQDLSGRSDLSLEKLNVPAVARDSDVVFLCLPHGNAAGTAKQFLDKKVRVIDLSADFRLKSASLYRKWYGLKHPFPDLLKQAVYGLPEVYREQIADARLVANPGCYATASILGALPLVTNKLIEPGSLIIDAKSGVSGAGKKMNSMYHFCEENENFLAYAVGNHRHMPEIEQELSLNSARASVTFVPHLLPVDRGILITLYAKMKKQMTSRSLWEKYAEFYEDEPFVVVLPDGSFPQIKAVQNTNFCQIGIYLDEKSRRIIIVCVIDNLGKGASGQAMQNMNLMFQMNEKRGMR